MKFIKNILDRNNLAIAVSGACEKCGRKIEVPLSNIRDARRLPYDLKRAVKCECGEYHNLIVKEGKAQSKYTPPNKTTETLLKCPRCSSTQLHAGNKGFGLGKATVGYLLAGPAGGVFGGLIGHKKIMITCLECGYKWQAGKK
jgi:tellurium resistance protein TerD